MDDRELLELDRLREILSYDCETGLFIWRRSNSNRSPVGSVAGVRVNSHGYKEIQIDGRLYKAHRLAWFYYHGMHPSGQIDHINGIRDDNRISNLRDVSGATNTHNQRYAHKNNKSGYLGVVLKDGKFCAEIRVAGKKKHLGRYKTPEDAHVAYVNAKRELHEGCTL